MREVLFPENLSMEDLDLGLGFAPGVFGQAGFHAGVFQEGLQVPAEVGRHLGQQDARMDVSDDEDAVLPDLDAPSAA